jgi:hypothetical protein
VADNNEIRCQLAGVFRYHFDLVTLCEISVGFYPSRSKPRNELIQQVTKVAFAAGDAGVS